MKRKACFGSLINRTKGYI